MARIYTRMTLAERLAKHTAASSEEECWLWKAVTLPHGYGRLAHQGKYYLAHRAAYEVAFGSIPEGSIVMHICDNPGCVRPSHLRLGTLADNTADMHAKGRGRKPESYQDRPLRTHCYKGHELTPDNVVWTNGGKSRRCLICYRASSQAGANRYVARHREEVNRRKRERRAKHKQDHD